MAAKTTTKGSQPTGTLTKSRQPAKGKPASKGSKASQAKAVQANEAGEANVVTVKEIAAKLNMSPKSLRASIRRMNDGPNPVGKGSRYSWPSMDHPDVLAILEKHTKADSEKA